VAALVALSGCAAAPADWATQLGAKLRCDMTISDVEATARKPVKLLNREWGTHFIEDDGTDVWLTFQEGKLKSYQTAWVRGLTIVEKQPRTDLCKLGK
jgi:hypothetical protein